MSADIESYRRLMGEDEAAAVQTITAYREVITTLISTTNLGTQKDIIFTYEDFDQRWCISLGEHVNIPIN